MAISDKSEFLRGTNLQYTVPVKTLPQAGGGAVIEEVIFDSGAYGSFDQGAAISGLYWSPSAAVAATATNAFTLTVEQYAADGTTHKATLGTYDARTTAAPKFGKIALLTVEAQLAAGDKLTYKLTQVGTGLAAPAGTLFVTHEQLSDEE